MHREQKWVCMILVVQSCTCCSRRSETVTEPYKYPWRACPDRFGMPQRFPVSSSFVRSVSIGWSPDNGWKDFGKALWGLDDLDGLVSVWCAILCGRLLDNFGNNRTRFALPHGERSYLTFCLIWCFFCPPTAESVRQICQGGNWTHDMTCDILRNQVLIYDSTAGLIRCRECKQETHLNPAMFTRSAASDQWWKRWNFRKFPQKMPVIGLECVECPHLFMPFVCKLSVTVGRWPVQQKTNL